MECAAVSSRSML